MTTPSQPEEHAIIIIGSGFAGMCAAIKLKAIGMHDLVILERSTELGGTWRDNHYPGAACDVPSILYSFSFEQNPNWTRKFPTQPELHTYSQHCAQKYDLLRHLRLQADVKTCRYDEQQAKWHVTTQDGRRFIGRILVAGVGGLSNPDYPKIPGLDQFPGPAFHSAKWDHSIDLTGKRVAVIGSGASAIQFVPEIAPKVARLDYYQRTPPWVLPKLDRPMYSWEKRLFRTLPWTQKIYRAGIYSWMEARVFGFVKMPNLMSLLEGVGRQHLQRIIQDPTLRRQLTPTYRPGCKRILISNNYYPALARQNVKVITDGIRAVQGQRIVTHDGQEREVDVIIYGTGFKVQEMAPKGFFIGRQGQDMADVWSQGAYAYRGTAVPGFPNLFILVGPNTALGHSSMIYIIESQVHYLVEAVKAMQGHQLRSVEVKAEMSERYNDSLQQAVHPTIWNTGGCKSWYLAPNGRNTTIWPSFTFTFRQQLKFFDLASYHTQTLGDV